MFPKLNIFDLTSSRPSVTDNKMLRRTGMKREVKITNISGKKAWIIISPTPIMQLGSLGLDKLGQISFNHSGEYKSQQSPLLDNSSRTFDLDSSSIYYSVFFECDGKWKIHFQDKKHDTSVNDIGLLPRHVDEAIDIDIKPAI